jgi:hypothetical protein
MLRFLQPKLEVGNVLASVRSRVESLANGPVPEQRNALNAVSEWPLKFCPIKPKPSHTMQKTIKSILQLSACLALALAFTAHAEDKKVDLTGTWKSSFTNQNDQVRETVFKLKAEGEKLTGTISGRNNDTAIEEGKIKGEEISFQVTREFNGNKMVIKYTGKVSGDTIKGKSEVERDGQIRSRDWVAKREVAKESAK